MNILLGEGSSFTGFIIYGRSVTGKLYCLAVSGDITVDQVRDILRRKEEAGLLSQTLIDTVVDLNLE